MPITCKKKLLLPLATLSLLFRFTKSVPSSECRTVVDLCLVIDGSDSISKGDYDKQRDATANLMTNLDIGDNRARVGIVVFSTTIAEEVALSSDKELLKKRAQSLPHPRDGTNTALGIKTMRAMFQSYGRPDTPWIGIVITDGISKDPKLTMEEAQKAREEGISLIAVGVTTLIDSTELLNIAGVESRVLKLESFDELKDALAGLAKTICPCDTPPVITHTVISPGPRTVGTVRLYECLEGYRGIGSGQIACLENSTWTIPTLECVACPEPPLITNAIVDPGDNLIKTFRNFRCNPGYIPSGPTVIECLANTTWSIPEFECIICGDTPIVPHSMILPGPHLIDTVRNYECEKGYIPVGPTNIKCKTDATWSPPEFQCVACMDPPVVPNAAVDVGSNLIGALRNYQCAKGFLTKGKSSIVCRADATWSPPEFICDVCGETPVVPKAVITTGDHFIGSVRVYQCDKGFLATGPTEIICKEDGLWSNPSIQCIACLDPPLVQHALLEPGSNLIGSLRNYICEKGFVATGPTMVECLPSAAWAPLQFTCVACTDPPLVSNSVVDIGSNLIGSVRTYTCKDGFVAKGKTSIVCQPDAHWSPPEFICDVCPETPIVPHAVIGPGDNFIGSLRVYQCEKGFRATAPTDIVCQKDGTWSQPAFQCVACPEPPLVKNALIEPGSNLIGSVRQYVCEGGFLASGPTTIECSPDGGWTLPQFSCIVCGDTPLIPNAKIRPGPHLLGTVRTYDCVEGYKAAGPTDILCLKDAMWSKPDFTCITCPEPPLVQNAVLEPGSSLIGSVRKYVCEKGYLASGPTAVECLADAVWSSPKFACIACQDPPLLQHALLEPGSNLIGSYRNYICEPGFVATGPTAVECLPDATWAPQQFTCIACTDPPLVSNSVVDIGSNLIGSVRTYTCKDGFVAKGKTSIVCQPDAHWSPPEFICDVCPETPVAPHAVIGPGDNFIGSLRLYQCEKGFRATAPTDIVCQKDGTWSQPAFQCVACPEPPLVKNALIEPGSNLIGSVRQYVCEDGFLASGPTTIECSPDGGWTLPQFSCIVCGDTPLIPNAKIRPGPHLLGTVRTYDCVEGYKAAGPTDILCLKDAMWSKPDFTCITCPEPPLVQNAVLEPGSSLIGSVRKYVCEKGYLASGPTAVECLADAVWSSPKFACIACQDPPLLQHALLEPGSNLIGSLRNYICEQGFVATGPTAVECLPDATWAPQQFTCIACTDPPLVSNSVVDIGSNLIGSVRTYTCKDGFVAKGKTSIVCQPDAHWSPPEFICDVCPETPVAPHAVIGPGDNFIGSLRLYQCEKGFRATAPTDIVCQKDGTWSQPAFQCVACPEPPLVKNALIEPGSNLIGSVRQYVCEDGFLASGPTTIECSPDGGWTLPQFSCIVCGDTPLIPNAKIRPGPHLLGTVRTYDCVEGYKAAGPTDILCLKDAMWSKPDFICISCPEPPLVQNAVVEHGSYLIGSVRQYICEKGYLASGPTAVECLADATWSSPKFSCIACEDPPIVPNALVDVGSNLIGSLRTYTCRDGYLAKGKTSLICQPDAHWSPIEFMCDVCGGVPLVPHALALPGPHLIGTVRNYECEKGYVATGPTNILCTNEAFWSPPTFECKSCNDPPLVENAIVDMGSNLIESMRTYVCNDGYLAKGDTSIICQKDATWSPVKFICDVCADPPVVNNALVRSGLNVIGTVRMYNCNLGYLAKGDTSIVCQKDATWSKPQFICDVCGPIPDVPNAIPLPGDHQIGSVIFYECMRGFIPDAPTDILCSNNATWSSPLFSCKTCPEPPPVKHAFVNPGLVLIGSERQYICDLGYLAKGDTGIVCQADATWSKTMFYCDVCGDLPIVKSAEILAGSHLIGSVRHYRCMDGLLATGPTDIICQKDATWSATAFQCISCGEVPLMENAVILSGSHLIGSIRKYECVKGFIPSSSTEIMCQKDATWSVPKFLCIACPKPPLVKNAVINPGENLVGSTRMYTCEEGYFAKGNTEITCLPDATWSAQNFVCDVCGPEPFVDNAVILPGSNLVGSFRLYQCAKGLVPSGSTKIVCQKDGTWSLPIFNCIGCGIPPLVKNAVVSPGESLIGEFRSYTCNEGLIPTGPAGILCQDNATWTDAEFTCAECRSLVDMIVVVDGSDSINAPGYEMLRGAIIQLIPELEMGDAKARVGIVVFSSDIHEVIPLTGNSTSLISKVKYLHHPRDGTNTAKGIQKMREIFQSNGRPDVPWLGIVITDGISKQPLQTKQEAESAKAEGVYMIAVGITDKINLEELQNISSSPKQVLQLETFGQLSKELVNLMRNVCRKKTPSLLHSIQEIKTE